MQLLQRSLHRSILFWLRAARSRLAIRKDWPPYPNSSSPHRTVTGIGGFFFKARDPEGLARWYAEYLGVNLVPKSYDESPWHQDAGPTVFAPFPATTGYLGDAMQTWMINFRVRGLDAMTVQLQAKCVGVEVDPQAYPNGRFARLNDPEGNPIQLWEPKVARA